MGVKEIQFNLKNTVGWNADTMQMHVFECHEEIKRQRTEWTLVNLENDLWKWIHEEMSCFLQHSATLDDPCKWVVLDVDFDVIAEGPTPLDAMKAAEKLYRNNLAGDPIR